MSDAYQNLRLTQTAMNLLDAAELMLKKIDNQIYNDIKALEKIQDAKVLLSNSYVHRKLA